MPLIHFHMLEGRSEDEISTLLDAAHGPVVEAFEVPVTDRYQLVSEHRPGRMLLLDTGLGLDRSDQVVLVKVTSSPRSKEQKQKFYDLLVTALQETCGIDPQDVIVSVVTNEQEDWSFGNGEAQYVTGAL